MKTIHAFKQCTHPSSSSVHAKRLPIQAMQQFKRCTYQAMRVTIYQSKFQGMHLSQPCTEASHRVNSHSFAYLRTDSEERRPTSRLTSKGSGSRQVMTLPVASTFMGMLSSEKRGRWTIGRIWNSLGTCNFSDKAGKGHSFN